MGALQRKVPRMQVESDRGLLEHLLEGTLGFLDAKLFCGFNGKIKLALAKRKLCETLDEVR